MHWFLFKDFANCIWHLCKTALIAAGVCLMLSLIALDFCFGKLLIARVGCWLTFVGSKNVGGWSVGGRWTSCPWTSVNFAEAKPNFFGAGTTSGMCCADPKHLQNQKLYNKTSHRTDRLPLTSLVALAFF